MEKLIEVFMESPEAGFALLKGMIEKYKTMAYDVAEIIMDIYKDFANNTEYPATVARVKRICMMHILQPASMKIRHLHL